ncbi:helix-turn-helix transcriptional regulator [Pararobbsia silviterrae]|uniref:XRE family transcriptional regulator n=1 Tax=Pararobbsia silviterrae TaxID=1792498 RepID=A0A494Y7T2_9BURK|nr:helix-turn-helix transcriptional regulator [Pararobbsia silviterrae]RKP56681.1 XRE family transcriptional regulator [Pararobbsia silviterrae]
MPTSPPTPPASSPRAARDPGPLRSPERELGAFIRAHRERLSPEAAGVPAGNRRRTPGLRREEVAQLCGVSPTWYTWIEQGRPVSASPDALARIAVALRLTRAERAYLFELAALRDPSDPTPGASDAPSALITSVALFDAPAYVLDRQWTILAWNARANDLFVGLLGSGDDHNLLRWMFTSEIARTLVVDWQARARRLVGEFRADSSRHLNDPPTRSLVENLLAASEDFAHFWRAQDVVEREGGVRDFLHPVHGALRFDQITLKPALRDDLKFVALIPLEGGARPEHGDGRLV